MDPNGSGMNKVAVILQYNGGYLPDNKLVIPDTLEAYRKFTDNTSARDFCLVTKDNSFLYYKTTVQVRENGDVGDYLYTVRDIEDSTNEYGKKVVPQRELSLCPDLGDNVYGWVEKKTVTETETDPETGADKEIEKQDEIQH